MRGERCGVMVTSYGNGYSRLKGQQIGEHVAFFGDGAFATEHVAAIAFEPFLDVGWIGEAGRFADAAIGSMSLPARVVPDLVGSWCGRTCRKANWVCRRCGAPGKRPCRVRRRSPGRTGRALAFANAGRARASVPGSWLQRGEVLPRAQSRPRGLERSRDHATSPSGLRSSVGGSGRWPRRRGRRRN